MCLAILAAGTSAAQQQGSPTGVFSNMDRSSKTAFVVWNVTDYLRKVGIKDYRSSERLLKDTLSLLYTQGFDKYPEAVVVRVKVLFKVADDRDPTYGILRAGSMKNLISMSMQKKYFLKYPLEMVIKQNVSDLASRNLLELQIK